METESFQQQAFQVRQPGENFDAESFVPQDGEEYLMKVIYERKQCPSVVVKPPKKVSTEQDQASALESAADASIASEINDISPVFIRPSSEWKQAQLEDFQAIREKIIKFRHELETNGYTSDKNMPLVDESESWFEFCRLNEPYLSTMLRINQRSLERLLEFQTEWLKNEIDGETIDLSASDDMWLGKWIYSTMICLRMPLEPDVHSSLRDIARTSISLRSKLQPDDQVAPYNLFIFLIAKCFGQLDFLEFV